MAVTGTNGKDRLIGTSASETYLAGDDDDVLVGSGGNDTINGGAGLDTVSYANMGPVTVTLGMYGLNGIATKRSSSAGEPGALPVMQTDILTSIENVIGSSYKDTINGNELDNILAGLGGDDTINGGLGNDTVDYHASRDAVLIDLRLTTAQQGGDAQGDKLSSIENVIGTARADTILGDSRANILRGGNGNDRLAGFAGGDTLDGGQGVDTADYSQTPLVAGFGGITVNLSTGQVSGGDAANDTLVSIENVIGTGRSDTLIGNDEANTLDGGAQVDTLAGLGGADTLIGGGGGGDFADYGASPEGVSVNLATNENHFGHAEGDKLDQIGGVYGSSYNDRLTGDARSNALIGGAGEDTLEGGKGGDVLVGRLIDLALPFEGEVDTFVYRSVDDSRPLSNDPGSTSNCDEIMLFEHGVDKIDLSAIDADVDEDGDQAFKLVDSFTGEAGQLNVFVTDGGANGYAFLQGDVDGDAVADLFISFYLPSLPPTESDILL